MLESDSLTLINALSDLSPPPSSVAALVYSLVATSYSFRCEDFSHVGRNGNKPAHHYKKIFLSQRFFPSVFTNRRNR